MINPLRKVRRCRVCGTPSMGHKCRKCFLTKGRYARVLQTIKERKVRQQKTILRGTQT